MLLPLLHCHGARHMHIVQIPVKGLDSVCSVFSQLEAMMTPPNGTPVHVYFRFCTFHACFVQFLVGFLW